MIQYVMAAIAVGACGMSNGGPQVMWWLTKTPGICRSDISDMGAVLFCTPNEQPNAEFTACEPAPKAP